MENKFSQFRDNILGQFVEVSYKPAIYQCMDLAYLWVFCLGFPKETIQNGYAYQVWTNPKPISREYFDFISNTPDAIPQAGDLVVWNSNVGGGAGHISIATGSGGLERFESLDQNWPVNSEVAIRRHDYINVLGWLRPKKEKLGETLVITDQTKIPQLDNMEVQAIRSVLSDQERALESLREAERVHLELIGALEEEIEALRAGTPVPPVQFSNPISKVLFEIAKALD